MPALLGLGVVSKDPVSCHVGRGGGLGLCPPRCSICERRGREPEAFARFYDAHAEALLAYLARRVYNADVAVELTAEVFAQAYLARDRFRGSTDSTAAAWLYTIAKRQLARHYRKRRVEGRAIRRLGIQRPGLDDQEAARIEELAELAELRSELSRLSVRNREALQLRVIEDVPYAEVARRLGTSEQTARARVSRGLKALAAALDAVDFKEAGV